MESKHVYWEYAFDRGYPFPNHVITKRENYLHDNVAY